MVFLKKLYASLSVELSMSLIQKKTDNNSKKLLPDILKVMGSKS